MRKPFALLLALVLTVAFAIPAQAATPLNLDRIKEMP